MTDLFAQYEDADVRDLIAGHPLAWMVSTEGRADLATQLPLLGEYNGEGKLAGLLGHLPRRHPLVAEMEASPRTLILFQGPQAYVSPEHAGAKKWAPTWNFAQLSIGATVRLVPEETTAALATLVEAMERGRRDPWDASEIEERYAALESKVIAFRAHVDTVVGRFKLGQDERPEVRASIIAAAEDEKLARWMRRFAERPKPS